VAAQVVKAARDFEATVTLRCRDCREARGCSILELMLLEAGQGTFVEIEADGADEAEALRAVADIFENGGGI
jgi:phosphotransferase system HPr (HPr) family protein